MSKIFMSKIFRSKIFIKKIFINIKWTLKTEMILLLKKPLEMI